MDITTEPSPSPPAGNTEDYWAQMQTLRDQLMQLRSSDRWSAGRTSRR